MMIRSFTRTARAALCPSLVSTALLSLGACTGPASITLEQPPFRVSLDGWRYVPPTHGPVGGVVPDLGSITPLSTSGAFTFEGELAPGSATVSAVVVDPLSEAPPTAVGSGSFLVPVDGVDYTGAGGDAIAASFPDESDLLLLAAFVMETDATGVDVGSVVWIVVSTADAVPGATVALDGETRLAVFGHGPLDREEPEITAVAVTGTVTFGAVDLAIGGTIEATLAGDFGRAVFEPGPTDPPIEPAPPFATGSYELMLLGPAEAHCEGSLAGREAEVAALSLGLSGGALEVAEGAGALTLSGASIEASFGAPSVDAAWQPEAAAFIAFTGGGAGALGLVEEGRYLITAGPDAEALIGVILADPADATGAAFCQVGVPATITAR
jgi:hypothetical protein